MDTKDPGVLRQIFDQTMAVMIIFGAMGGLTNALVTKQKLHEAFRLTIIGALISGGVGTLAPLILSKWVTAITPEMSELIGIIAGSCYIVGAIGAAGLEVILAKIRSRAPAQGDTDATNV